MRIGRDYRWSFLALTWAAALFIAFGSALTPFLPTSSKSWIEICTAYGTTKIAVADKSGFSETGTPVEDKKSSPHCLFCNLRQLNLLALAPAPVALPAPSALLLSLASEDSRDVPVDRHAARPYSPRAPPFYRAS